MKQKRYFSQFYASFGLHISAFSYHLTRYIILIYIKLNFPYCYTGLDDCEDDCERKCGGDLQEEYDALSPYETPPPPMPPVQPPLCQEGAGTPVYPKQNERPEIVHNPLLLGRLTMHITTFVKQSLHNMTNKFDK